MIIIHVKPSIFVSLCYGAIGVDIEKSEDSFQVGFGGASTQGVEH